MELIDYGSVDNFVNSDCNDRIYVIQTFLSSFQGVGIFIQGCGNSCIRCGSMAWIVLLGDSLLGGENEYR